MVVNKGISVTYMSSTTSATCGAGIAYPSRTPEFTPVFGGVRDARSLIFYVALCRSLFVLLSFFIWLWYCVSFCPFSFGHGIVCTFVLFHVAMVLCVLLSFFIWPWYCVYFCPFSFGHGIVCTFVLFHLAMVLCVLLSFFIWLWYCVSSCPFSFGHGIVCPLVLFHVTWYCVSSCPFSFGRGIVCPFVLFHSDMVLCVLLSFFIWLWYCVSSCPFSFGHGIVCPSVYGVCLPLWHFQTNIRINDVRFVFTSGCL